MAENPEPTLADQVMDYVRRAVSTGEIVTGAWYSVHQLSEALGFSRTPVRDGLLRLEEAGLLKFTANRGFQIVANSPEDIAEIYALRLGIEVPAAGRAAQQHTPGELDEAERLVELMARAADTAKQDVFFRHERSLHALVLRIGRSERGAKLVEQLRPHTRLIGRSVIGPVRSLHDILAEFDALLDALRQRDPEAASGAMRTHLTLTGWELLEQAVELSGTDAEPAQIWQIYADGL